MTARLPIDEAARLRRLHRLKIVDSPGDRRLDAITARAKGLFPGASMAAISLVDADRQVFKSSIGLDVAETPRSISFCAHAILGTRPLVVKDATQDVRFADNELVTDAPGIRFYAGAPIMDGVGALCVMHTSPIKPGAGDIQALSHLARSIDDHLQLHGALLALAEAMEPGTATD